MIGFWMIEKTFVRARLKQWTLHIFKQSFVCSNTGAVSAKQIIQIWTNLEDFLHGILRDINGFSPSAVLCWAAMYGILGRIGWKVKMYHFYILSYLPGFSSFFCQVFLFLLLFWARFSCYRCEYDLCASCNLKRLEATTILCYLCITRLSLSLCSDHYHLYQNCLEIEVKHIFEENIARIANAVTITLYSRVTM